MNETAPISGAARGPATRPARLFMKQAIMLRVLWSLMPVALVGVYFFGWRVLGVVGVCFAAGLGTEYITSRQRGQPISMACFVTCMLYALSLPPTVPMWIAAVGVIVGVLFGKEVFGGFGRNFANPAIVGRVFVYVCFPVELTGRFVPVFRGFPGGFGQWSMARFLAGARELPAYLAGKGIAAADAITAATPMWAKRDFQHVTSTWQLLVGDVGGTFTDPATGDAKVLAAGCIGEVCAIVLILAGAYLLITKTANWRLTLATLAGAAAVTGLLHYILGIGAVLPMEQAFFAGSLLYGAIFMVTDPVSAPKQRLAMYAYGAFIGAMIVLLRWKGQFADAVGFAILLGNLVGPLLDMGAKAVKARPRGGSA